MDVSPENYTRHISSTLSDPIRMRQLLLWVVQRSGAETGTDVKALMEGLASRRINTSWYGEKPVEVEGMESHPINVGNRERIEEYAAAIVKIKGEEMQWVALNATNVKRRAEQAEKADGIENVLRGDVGGARVFAEGIVDMGMLEEAKRAKIAAWATKTDEFEHWISGIKLDVRVNVRVRRQSPL
jgi:hypothetical protein